MIDPLIYHIPITQLPAYRGRNLVVRSRDPAEIIAGLDGGAGERCLYVQLLGLGAAIDRLACWEVKVPMELVIENPEAELPLLYRYSPLLMDRPIRVAVPLVAGFGKVVRLSVSLDFAVKIEGGQPTLDLIEELLGVASDYLHRSTLTVPIEFIHSLFQSFYRQEPVSLWDIQEENPHQVRYITDQGEEALSKRLARVKPPADPRLFRKDPFAGLLAQGGECRDCQFVNRCGGYFKWPDKEYPCDGIKNLLRMLEQAAAELRRDLALYQAQGKWSSSV